MKRSPFEIIKHRHVTEKARVLEGLKAAASNPSIRKYENPKYVFIVDRNANKHEIAAALEEIYAEKKIRVIGVNTTNVKPKRKWMRGREGFSPGFKKAIVTLEVGDAIDEQV